MTKVAQLAAGEHAALARIRALAAEEGERRFRGVAQDVGLALGSYEGRACTLVRDVAPVFGVTDRAVQKMLAEVATDLPGASAEFNPANLQGTNFKFVPNATRITLVFWPGFLACALRGRTDVARRLALALVQTEERERVATAAATVTREEYSRVLAQRNELAAALEDSTKQLAQLAAEQRHLRQLGADNTAAIERIRAREQSGAQLLRLLQEDVDELRAAVGRRPGSGPPRRIPAEVDLVDRIAEAVARRVAPAAPLPSPPPSTRADDAFGRLVAAWWQAHVDSQVTARMVRGLAVSLGVLRDLIPSGFRGPKAEEQAVADALVARAGRPVGGFVVRTSFNASTKTRRYRLEVAAPTAPAADGGAR